MNDLSAREGFLAVMVAMYATKTVNVSREKSVLPPSAAVASAGAEGFARAATRAGMFVLGSSRRGRALRAFVRSAARIPRRSGVRYAARCHVLRAASS